MIIKKDELFLSKNFEEFVGFVKERFNINTDEALSLINSNVGWFLYVLITYSMVTRDLFEDSYFKERGRG